MCIGRLDPVTETFIPNDNYRKYYDDRNEEINPATGSYYWIGATFLIGSILDYLGVTDTLSQTLGPEGSAN
ncbi:MAG: hypothetical protein LBS60_01225 [Deltaproteobacteria bacterium]|nr:hypothetical protein [Deltaproteobacteria bacterium]